MKKLILLAGILTAGFVSANNNLPEEVNEIKVVKEAIAENTESTTQANKEVLRQICVVFYATCTSAYTCFEGNSFEDVYDDAVEWAGNVQANYCMLNSPFKP